MKGGIKKGDWEGLKRYIKAALKRCECELDRDRVDEIELFLVEKYWLKNKNIPTRKGKKDPAVKWALREKLRDICFQNHTISNLTNKQGEKVDIFEVVAKNDDKYREIERLHDLCKIVGSKTAKALLFSLYTERKKRTTENRQAVLF